MQIVRLSSQDVPTAYAFELEAATIVQPEEVVKAVQRVVSGAPVLAWEDKLLQSVWEDSCSIVENNYSFLVMHYMFVNRPQDKEAEWRPNMRAGVY